MFSRKISLVILLAMIMILLASCGRENRHVDSSSKVTISVFAAKSLNSSMDEIISLYKRENPSVEFLTNYDSSGTLLTQIVEGGADCDVFVSASEKEIDALEAEGLIVEGTRQKLLSNKMCLVTYTGSNTKVTGLENIGNATSLAIAGPSVPIGRYTRKALVNVGILEANARDYDISSQDISKALGNATINECQNAGAVLAAIVEESNEVGTVYYSDTYGYEDKLQIIETISNDITGEIVYPVAQIRGERNSISDRAEIEDDSDAEIKQFIEFLKSNKAKEVFVKHRFTVDDAS